MPTLLKYTYEYIYLYMLYVHMYVCMGTRTHIFCVSLKSTFNLSIIQS